MSWFAQSSATTQHISGNYRKGIYNFLILRSPRKDCRLLEQELANIFIFCKGLDDKDFRIRKPHTVTIAYHLLMLYVL